MVDSGFKLAWLLVILCWGCTGREPVDPASVPGDSTAPAGRADAGQTSPSTGRDAAADADTTSLAFTILPGERIGHVQVGERMEAVRADLGRPDSGNAAMGKAWSFWFSGTGATREELGVYSSLGDSMRHHLVRQIRITSPAFSTPSGLSTRSTLADVERVLSPVKAVAEYTTETASDPVTVYDAREAGIAFEVVTDSRGDASTGRVIAIVVHRSGDDVARQYIPRHNYRLLNE